MKQEEIGKFIKKLRIQSNMTQAEFALKYNVTYQAVSKWENGKNLPDLPLLKQICEDFNINLDEILNGKKKNEKNKYIFLIIFFVILLIILCIVIYNKSDFKHSGLYSNCGDFKITGSIAYNKSKSSIYISSIDYCGSPDNTVYNIVECALYEKNNNIDVLISHCKNGKDINLDDYLKKVYIKIDNYKTVCKDYTNLYLGINATDKNNKTTVYTIPLKLEDSCKN